MFGEGLRYDRHPLPAPSEVPRDVAASSMTAARIIRERALRARLFPQVEEPGWLMLLDLYANPGRDVSVTSACGASFVPWTTALRHIDLLEAGGLVEREHDPKDRRRVFLRLTQSAVDALADYFGDHRAASRLAA